MKILISVVLQMLAVAAFAEEPPVEKWVAVGADVYILGELHDNPDHHALQTQFVGVLNAKAVVYEMLTAEEAQDLTQVPRDPEKITAALGNVHWDNIEDYAEILAKSAVIVGAAQQREVARQAFSNGAAVVFGSDADSYGLNMPLDKTERETREEAQFASHCEAMPREMMGGMVEAQRLRDAAFARAVVEAVGAYGSPVVLITGNGHARGDWGVPRFLNRVAPELTLFTLGQGETPYQPQGGFDATWLSQPHPRPDPCEAFR